MLRLTTTNSHLDGSKNPCKELSVEDFKRLVREMITSNTARISAQVIARHSAKTLINVATSCCLQRFLKVQTPNAATERCRKDHKLSKIIEMGKFTHFLLKRFLNHTRTTPEPTPEPSPNHTPEPPNHAPNHPQTAPEPRPPKEPTCRDFHKKSSKIPCQLP